MVDQFFRPTVLHRTLRVAVAVTDGGRLSPQEHRTAHRGNGRPRRAVDALRHVLRRAQDDAVVFAKSARIERVFAGIDAGIGKLGDVLPASRRRGRAQARHLGRVEVHDIFRQAANHDRTDHVIANRCDFLGLVDERHDENVRRAETLVCCGRSGPDVAGARRGYNGVEAGIARSRRGRHRVRRRVTADMIEE